MNRVCLDTSAYSHFKRGEESAVRVVAVAREIHVPVVVLGELRAGFRMGKRAKENETELREFLADSAVRTLEVDDEAATLYADLVQDLRRAGKPLPTNDVWIAALAVREGSVVVTYDAHFRAIRRVGSLILEPSAP